MEYKSYLAQRKKMEALKKENGMRLTLPDGSVLEGTEKEIRQWVHGKDPKEWYKSGSKGWVRIKNMHSNHLRNAILKAYRSWLGKLSTNITDPMTNDEFFKAVLEGPTDITLAAMLQEVSNREDGK